MPRGKSRPSRSAGRSSHRSSSSAGKSFRSSSSGRRSGGNTGCVLYLVALIVPVVTIGILFMI